MVTTVKSQLSPANFTLLRIGKENKFSNNYYLVVDYRVRIDNYSQIPHREKHCIFIIASYVMFGKCIEGLK